MVLAKTKRLDVTMAALATDKVDPIMTAFPDTLTKADEPRSTVQLVKRTVPTSNRNEGRDADDNDTEKLDSTMKPGVEVVLAADVVVNEGLLTEKNETPDIFPAQKKDVDSTMLAVGGSHNVDAAASVTAALRAVDSGALGNAQSNGREGCCVIASLVTAAM